jgi:hypothetical protein
VYTENYRNKMPQLRGHHLICLHFFHGEGFDENFISNLSEIMKLAEEGTVTISAGADDVCKKCVYLRKGRCEHSEDADKEVQKMDTKALALLGLSARDKVQWAELKADIVKIFQEWYFQYCTECEWKAVCEKDDYYRGLTDRL